jgi:hypothetical protein
MGSSDHEIKANIATMEVDYDNWLESVDTSHIQPLEDDWNKHPFWADPQEMQNPDSEAGKIVQCMQNEFTPKERAMSCKVSTPATHKGCCGNSAPASAFAIKMPF